MSDQDNRRKWEYTLEDIAEHSGVSIHTVRDHKAKGFLQPADLSNVARYIVGHRFARPPGVTGRKGAVETDAWGNPV